LGRHTPRLAQIVFDNGPLVLSSNTLDLADAPEPGTQGFELLNAAARQRPGCSGSSCGLRFEAGSARVVEIEFTAPTYVAAQETKFRYRLEGWDKDWLEGGSTRKAYYANLRPGGCKFRLGAAGRNGGWSESEASIAFEIEPFFRETIWFYGVCLSAAGGLAISSRLRKTRRIAELEQQIALDDQRKRIARDIHDELGASLTQIAQLSEDALEAPEGLPCYTQPQARRIADLAEEAVANIGEIVWANNPRYDTLEDLVAYLREYAAKYLGATSLKVSLSYPEQVPTRVVPGPFRRYLLAILKEVLHNLVKHSGATKVDVLVSLSQTHLELTVHDDGIGIVSDNARRGGNGLVNIRERAAELGGSCHVESASSEGTTVSVKVPLPQGI
jgi:signal transduction histidine kinase